MASNHTEHYGLNQWELSDSVVMADFNEDNRKIDAALAAGIRGEVRDINFGNQIRSYVLQPYTMVKDHRTDCEVGNAGAVLDGGLQPFINAYLKWQATTQKPEEG